MIRITILATLVCAVSFVGAADAEDLTPGFNLNSHADLCFEETLKVQNDAAPEPLSTVSCNRALRFEPIAREQRSLILHNRGLIEQAQGELEAARISFTRAVGLSRTVDARNVALAQLAYKLRYFDVALRQYDLLLGSTYTSTAGQGLETALLRNRDRAARALASTRLASNQD